MLNNICISLNMITKWSKDSNVPLKDHLNKIEYFCIVAETGSLRKASEIARIVQPRLTKVIQELEEVLGVSLIVRSARGISLTKEGILARASSTYSKTS